MELSVLAHHALDLDLVVSNIWWTHVAAFGSSTPSSFRIEQLGFVLRLPRWYDRCLPLRIRLVDKSSHVWTFSFRRFSLSAAVEFSDAEGAYLTYTVNVQD
jgi:hypothetical protein